MKCRNGFFQLIHKENGTALKLYPPAGEGKKLTYDMVTKYLERQKISDYNIRDLHDAITNLETPTEIMITKETCFPVDEYGEVFLNSDKTVAKVTFYPPSSKGKQINKQEILNDFRKSGLRYGVKEQVLDAYIKERQYCTEFIIAEAKQPVEGRNAEIIYHFKTDGFGKPKMNEDGTVNFHQLDMICSVEKDEVLATLKPAVSGEPGTDVTGSQIMPAKVAVKQLKHGRNIYLSEDGLTMYAEVSGHVSLVEDKVFLADNYEVPADVGVASGDIDYTGNVEVKGNVVSGFTVRAKGDIIVNGVVEGATLIAGGQIILKRGIQGNGRGLLQAKGNITARFIENCKVYTEGDIVADAILHSHLEAKGSVTATGKKSIIAGGEVKAGSVIKAKYLGTAMGVNTDLSIGITAKEAAEMRQLETVIKESLEEQKKYTTIISIYRKKLESGEKLNDMHKEKLAAVTNYFKELQETLTKKNNRYKELKEKLELSKDGCIKYKGSAYSGVKVTIGGVPFFVKDELSYGRFTLDGADIHIGTY